MYNNFAVSADESRLDGQEPLSEWAHGVDINTEDGFGRRLSSTGVQLPTGLGREFDAAWASVAGARDAAWTYPHRDVPIYDGQYIWWGRTLTGYAFVRGSGDGLSLPAAGEYVIPLFTGRELTQVDDPQIERVVDRSSAREVSTEQRTNVRMWLEMPLGWRPEGAADDSPSAEGAERPLQVGDIVRIRSDYPRGQIPAEWRSVDSAFRARIETIVEGDNPTRAYLIPLVDRPDGFGRSGFNWTLDAWERVEDEGQQVAEQATEQVAEPTSGGKTAAEWEARWNRFWEEGAQRAQDRGYWRAFAELAEEFQVEANAPYKVEGRLRLEVTPRMGGSSGRVTTALISSILYEELRRRNERMREQGYEDMVLNLDAIRFTGMERVDE